MKSFLYYILIFVLLAPLGVRAQLNTEQYFEFRNTFEDMNYSDLEFLYPRAASYYYKGYNNTPALREVAWLDSVEIKLGLTNDEKEMLNDNHFFVSERMKYKNFGDALHMVYNNDLPVFISTDAILHALHMSYDNILKTCERGFMVQNIEEFLKSIYNDLPHLAGKYSEPEMQNNVKDVDLYVTVAYSLITGKKQPLRYADKGDFDEVMQAINNETLTEVSLFSNPDKKREIDFSQFMVRGHYVYTEIDKAMGLMSLEPYFRTMMWLGRIDFFLSKPGENPFEQPWETSEIKRMNISACMLNDLSLGSDNYDKLAYNNEVIDYLIGESDNVTISDFAEFLNEQGVTDASQLIDKSFFESYYAALQSNETFKQRIMGGFLMTDPWSDVPTELPISYRLSGQRFIIDSEVLSNVVYDRIIFEGEKQFRMMPDPLDVLFALGNSDAEYFLREELERYHYASDLANMRYLIDSYDDDFWQGSLYNSWLNALKQLNPESDSEKLPFFAKTSAWHQQKMNTQLASWAQLRHDNLLYAKPSYTGGTGCSYPRSFVEPYPKFYAALRKYAQSAKTFFKGVKPVGFDPISIPSFFDGFAETMGKLEVLAQKELDGKVFSDIEKEWLQKMLFRDGGSGAPPYSGWYAKLYFNPNDVIKVDHICVDIHTQPTNEAGVVVGNVLHTGLGNINLGVFMVNDTYGAGYTAYVGPFMSYYEEITSNFERLTDQDWAKKMKAGNVPERPEWTNAYLIKEDGRKNGGKIELPSVQLVGSYDRDHNNIKVARVYPNPTNGILNIDLLHDEDDVEITVFDFSGREFSKYQKREMGEKTLKITFENYKTGIYLLKISTSKGTQVEKISVK